MMPEKRPPKKLEFSKIIVIIFTIIEIAITIFSCVVIWETKNTDALAYLIPSVSVVGSTGVAFYFNKAKLENKIKLMKANGVEMTDSSFNET